jgi:hypothetical protein
VPLTGDTPVGEKDQVQFESEELDTLDDFDEEVSLDILPVETGDSVEKAETYSQERVNARHEIERMNELKALKSELDEWDDLLDEDDL